MDYGLCFEFRCFGYFFSTQNPFRPHIFTIGRATVFWSEHTVIQTAGTYGAAKDAQHYKKEDGFT